MNRMQEKSQNKDVMNPPNMWQSSNISEKHVEIKNN